MPPKVVRRNDWLGKEIEMEYFIGAAFLFVWVSIGFGAKSVFVMAKHPFADFPLLPIVWPIALMIEAYSSTGT